MSDGKTYKVQIIVAIIGLIGVIGASIIGNWESFFSTPVKKDNILAIKKSENTNIIRKISTHDIEWLSSLPEDKCADLGEAIYKDIKFGYAYYFKDIFKNKTKKVQVKSISARLSTYKYRKKRMDDIRFRASDQLLAYSNNIIPPNVTIPIQTLDKPFKVDIEPDGYFTEQLKTNIVVQYRAVIKYRGDIDGEIHEEKRLKCVLYRIVPANSKSDNLEANGMPLSSLPKSSS